MRDNWMENQIKLKWKLNKIELNWIVNFRPCADRKRQIKFAPNAETPLNRGVFRFGCSEGSGRPWRRHRNGLKAFDLNQNGIYLFGNWWKFGSLLLHFARELSDLSFSLSLSLSPANVAPIKLWQVKKNSSKRKGKSTRCESWLSNPEMAPEWFFG